ncbi:unnamed protein product [Brassica rapa]|uniref:Uncharacterized protein n=1 Tax=Brassica campestris TaxID=3711 RepID=A0A8D9D5B7_BRACM|nr:unnamed protein product [Brassica rapa]
MCVLTDTHGRPVCADRHPRTSCTTHGRPVCADRHPRTSCVCGRTHMDSHGRLVCADRHPRTAPDSLGRASVLSPRTNVLICVLMDSHRRPVCADGHTRTHTDSHGYPVCADRHPRTQPTWAKITRTVHGKGQHAESKDQRADFVLSPRTNVLICILMNSHGRHVCADGHTRTHMDSHGRPVCADGHTRTHMDTSEVLCVLADTHGRPVCTEQTAHSPGRANVLSPRTNVLICVLMDSHGRPVCADGHKQTHTDSHGCPVCADRHPWTSCLC